MSGLNDDLTRRKMNVMEALTTAALIGLSVMIFSMREAVIKLQVLAEVSSEQMSGLKTQLNDMPALSQRVTTLEIRQAANIENIRALQAARRTR